MKSSHRSFLEVPSHSAPNLSFIFNLSPSAITLGLRNMRELLARIGHPERAFRSICVAGTNGKGSVAAYLSSILAANGLKVGRYTSPHVYSVTERIWVDGKPVTLERMESLASRVVPLHASVPFSYFEALTAIAFLEFAESGVDYAVLEVGLGGRFDATNVVEPSVTVLTNISLDHRKTLGDCELEILREKLGIARQGVPLLVGDLSPALIDNVEKKAKRERIPLQTLREVGSASLEEISFERMRVRIRTRRADYGDVSLPFPGEQQTKNALLAVGAAEHILRRIDHVPRAISETYLPGRFEAVECAGKTIVLDVAHNDAALIATADTFGCLSGPECSAIVLGVMRRKELIHSPRRLVRGFRRLYLVAPEGGEAYTPEELLAKIGPETVEAPGKETIVWNGTDPARGWERLIESVLHPSNSFSAVLVTGSHRTVESFGRRLLERGSHEKARVSGC